MTSPTDLQTAASAVQWTNGRQLVTGAMVSGLFAIVIAILSGMGTWTSTGYTPNIAPGSITGAMLAPNAVGSAIGAVSGSITGTLPGPLAIAPSGVTAGTYGSASSSLSATVGADGRLTSLSSQAISIAASALTGTLSSARLPYGSVTLEQFGGGPGIDLGVAQPPFAQGPWASAMAAIDTYPYGGRLVIGTGSYISSAQLVAKITEGKTLEIDGQGCVASRLQYTGASNLPLIYAGSPIQDGSNLIMRGFGFNAPANPAANTAAAYSSLVAEASTAMAIEIYNRPGVILDDICIYAGYNQGIYLAKSYGPHFKDFVAASVAGTALVTEPDGTANDLMMDAPKVTSSGLANGVPGMIIQGGADGLTAIGINLQSLDLESSTLQLANIAGAHIAALYAEIGAAGAPATLQSVVCATSCNGVDFDAPWLGQQAAVMTFANFKNSQVFGASVYDRTITFDPSATNFTWGPANVLSGGSVTNSPPPNTATLQNSWTANTSYPPVGYRKLADGTILLQGLISGGATNTVAFSLPVGYRPFQQREFAVSNSQQGTSYVGVATNGNVVIESATGGYVDLDGVRFVP